MQQGRNLEDIEDDDQFLQLQLSLVSTQLAAARAQQQIRQKEAEKNAKAGDVPQNGSFASDDHSSPIYIRYRTKRGEYAEFDISESACRKFGFYYMDRVNTPNGRASGELGHEMKFEGHCFFFF